jgi:hypothetical protein
VPEHDRQRIRERTLNHFEIGVAQAACADANENIRRRERRHRQRLDRERRVDLVEDGGLEVHFYSSYLNLNTEVQRTQRFTEKSGNDRKTYEKTK